MDQRIANALAWLGLVVVGGCVAPQPQFDTLMVEIHRLGDGCRVTVDGRPVGYPFSGAGRGDWELVASFHPFARRRFLVLADADVPYRCTDVVLAAAQKSQAANINYRTVEPSTAAAVR